MVEATCTSSRACFALSDDASVEADASADSPETRASRGGSPVPELGICRGRGYRVSGREHGARGVTALCLTLSNLFCSTIIGTHSLCDCSSARPHDDATPLSFPTASKPAHPFTNHITQEHAATAETCHAVCHMTYPRQFPRAIAFLLWYRQNSGGIAMATCFGDSALCAYHTMPIVITEDIHRSKPCHKLSFPVLT